MANSSNLDPTTQTALRTMHDIVVPPPVSWFPQTWGWVVLAVLLLAVVCIWVILSLKRYRHNAYRREALRQLELAATDIRTPDTKAHGLRTVAELIKRTALVTWPREVVAADTGGNWTTLLAHSSATDLDQNFKRLLDDLEYRGERDVGDVSDTAVNEIIASARQWIKMHHVSA